MDEQVQGESFPPISQSHTQPPLHSTVNLKFLGLGILFVLIVATGAFLVGERWQRSQPVTPILTPSIKVTPPNDKYLTDAVYCEKDEDCISQKVSCNNCGCPIPKNVYNDQSPQCDLSKIKNGPHCDIYCSPTVPKCSNSKCTLVDPNITTTLTPQTTSLQFTEDQFLLMKKKYSSELGIGPGKFADDIKYEGVSNFASEIYLVNFMYMLAGKPVATEGGHVLVKYESPKCTFDDPSSACADPEWVVGIPGDGNYCLWVEISDIDENTKAFMEQSCK